jgi:GMP synthase (glutamine-hydrolysing)
VTATIACLHNLAQPFLGLAGDALRDGGAELVEHDVAAGASLPGLDAVDGLVVFGGEQSVADAGDDPILAAELDLLRRAVDRETPVLGVCLGAQLLAVALGGRLAVRGRRMVAWHSPRPLPEADGDPLVAALDEAPVALHWNEDWVEPPPGAVELLERPGPGAEMFRCGASAWGVQFHPEVDAAVLDRWYASWGGALVHAGVGQDEARAADRRWLPAQHAQAAALFGAFAGVVAAARP